MDPSAAPAPSLLAGRYQLRELIGQGAAGRVYRARDEFLQQDVAVKISRNGAADSADARRQQRELKILQRLAHPGLVVLLDAGVDVQEMANPRTYLVMELVEGSNLRQRLKNGLVPRGDAMQWSVDLLQSLAYVHAEGVVHRDIKPANILIPAGDAGTGRSARLSDFGLAIVLGNTPLTMQGTTTGTAAYLSPEQATGELVETPSDIYSLGLVLLECLTGVVAFPGPPLESIVGRLVRSPAVPEDLGAWVPVLRAMTARLPQDRPSAAEAAAMLAPGVAVPA
ncbi:serine/threonine protein kinase [Paenarthrobacter sp. DKR-5]|uniref:serine/threonine-protein kinase n=1 Tax=Paenarthrobacter sp. DKR-5 TaxID=2835535 RepID=UPI001BDD11B2|nr:serine/threonine-protein kinase [Paenarthrobacter sp. DKR-5]MBT1001608.1 serine/threonine protein kinase [Paenarthrobacter sp. DKR-5]